MIRLHATDIMVCGYALFLHHMWIPEMYGMLDAYQQQLVLFGCIIMHSSLRVQICLLAQCGLCHEYKSDSGWFRMMVSGGQNNGVRSCTLYLGLCYSTMIRPGHGDMFSCHLKSTIFRKWNSGQIIQCIYWFWIIFSIEIPFSILCTLTAYLFQPCQTDIMRYVPPGQHNLTQKTSKV